MAIDDLYVPGTVFAVAEDEQGDIGGFLHLAPTPAGGGWSLSTMRRRRGRPERADGVPHRRDARVGEGARRPGGLAELLRVHGAHLARARGHRAAPPPPARAARRRRRVPARAPLRRSTGSSSRSGGRATCASSGSATCRSSGSRISTSSSCSSRPDRGCAARRSSASRRVTLRHGPARHAHARTPVGDRPGDGAARLRLLLRGAPDHRPDPRPLRRLEAWTRKGRRRRAASTCARSSTSSGRRS